MKFTSETYGVGNVYVPEVLNTTPVETYLGDVQLL